MSGDRKRFNLAHELGHRVLDLAGSLDCESSCHRFAGAFLVPAFAARRELTPPRQRLGIEELVLLKRKYGMSMQAWIYRAKDLKILSEHGATGMFREFSRRGYRKHEPGAPLPAEQPTRMQRLVSMALAEDLISRSKAAELLGMPLSDFLQQVIQEPAGDRDMLCN